MKKTLQLFALAITLVYSATLFAQTNITLQSKLTYTQDLADVWGYAAAGKEYALVGTKTGVSIVDVTTPTTPSELFFINGSNSTWRDMATYNKHAYVTNETGNGLMIIDLTSLPLAIDTFLNFSGTNFPFTKAHNLIIDENGICYIFGSNYQVGGAIMLDLKPNPEAPVELGVYNDYYIHDGNVRGDTLWVSCINDGFEAIVDVSNKANPVTLQTFNTPMNFTHNSWYSDNGKYVFTTDEKANAPIAAYDVTDLNNIKELDRYYASPQNTGIIPHNVHFMNNYIIASHYSEGLKILDVSHPDNMVEVGNYDTSPNFTNDFHGAWGAYPWLPSGNILISDFEEGLYILSPNYVRASFLEGNVLDSTCGLPLGNVTIEIIGASVIKQSKITGNYKMGTATAGTYAIKFSKAGYTDLIVNNVVLQTGVVTNLNVKLLSPGAFAINGVVNTAAGTALANANISFSGSDNFNFVTDANGQFTQCNFIAGNYDVVVNKWGYHQFCLNNQFIDSNTDATYTLNKGYYDDFAGDNGWSITGNASSGVWERAVPIGTTFNATNDANPNVDWSSDCSNYAYVTGNKGTGCCDDDIDNGITVLSSPSFDATSFADPYIGFFSWYFNPQGSIEDSLIFLITNGTDTVIMGAKDTSSVKSQWVLNNLKISNYLTPSVNMKFIIEARDIMGGNVIEAGFDVFQISDSLLSGTGKENLLTTNEMDFFPNPFSSEINMRYNFKSKGPYTLKVYDVIGKVVLQKGINTPQGQLIINEINSPGIYLISVSNKNGSVGVKRIVKK